MNKPHKLKDPNALNFFKLRKLNRIPPHFEFISVPLTYNLQGSIEKWIMANLKVGTISIKILTLMTEILSKMS